MSRTHVERTSGYEPRLVRVEGRMATFDGAGRLRGTPNGTVGQFPSEANVVKFTPTTPTDWHVVPTTLQEALDEIANRLTLHSI